MLDFIENPDESAAGIVALLEQSLDKFGLSLEQVTAFSADNTNVNYGIHNSVFTNLKEKHKDLLQGNCHAHIVHNTVMHALDKLSVDVESVMLKVYGHFSISAKRREALKEFCEFCNVEFQEILSSTVNTKMALKNLTSTKVDIPTFVPTPLRVAVLKAETPRVISWTFDDFSVKPAVIKKNKTVVITDGQSLAKITLYEGSGSRLEEGGSYVMRGHSLRGRGPPYFINVARNTMFFRGPAIKFSEELMADAEKQVNPSSSVVHLEKYTSASSLVTVHINIIEIVVMLLRVILNENNIRRITIDDLPETVEDFFSIIKDKLGVEGPVVVQYQDPEFDNELCNLTCLSELPKDKATLRVKSCESFHTDSTLDTASLSSSTEEAVQSSRRRTRPLGANPEELHGRVLEESIHWTMKDRQDSQDHHRPEIDPADQHRQVRSHWSHRSRGGDTGTGQVTPKPGR
ncbi:uncharacterized protein V6R79_012893 [Siganus canaliculatus]